MAVVDASIQKESQDRYLTYALSVVSGRALPDVRDGLKPVQRRILYAMLENLKLTPSHSYRKSAAVVGEVLAGFHPHGDTACYDAMVRMAQDFSLRYPLVDGQGNFGSLDGDSAAAYRYTEAKLREIALDVLGEIGEETVEFVDNFDATRKEPCVLPSRVPNLLINGAQGIAVGMSTSIPPHNLRDVIKCLIELSNDPEMSNAKLGTILKAPDFPTGCLILNSRSDLNKMYESGQGQIRMRGEWQLEDGPRGKRYIIITSIPYGVNKAQLVERIANLIIEKKVPQLNDVRDESTAEVRVVLEVTSNSDPEAAMAFLFKHSPLESNFLVNMTALVPAGPRSTRPELLSLKACLQHFITFREEVTKRRLQFEKKNLLERIHILEGFAAIFDKLDEAIKIVRKSEGRSDAAEKLAKRFKLTEIQSFAIVDLRIYQLSRTNIDEIMAELKLKQDRLKEIEKILKSSAKISAIVREDLERIGEKYGDKRKSKLVTDNVEIEYNAADYIVEEEVYAIVTKDGWIKRIRQNNEIDSTRVREGDEILAAHPLSTLDSVVLLTNQGYVYTLPVNEFPSSSGYGNPVQKTLKFRDGESIVCSFALRAKPGQPELFKGNDLKENDELLLVSRRGVGFILKFNELASVKRNGRRAMKLRDGDALAAVCADAPKFLFVTHDGNALVIESKEVPRKDSAVIGVSLLGVRTEDHLVSALALTKQSKLVLKLGTGNTKDVPVKDVVSGHRALKGNKIVSRSEVLSAILE